MTRDNAFAFLILRFLRGPFTVTNLTRSLVLGCSVLALAACGPEDLGSPGANGDINIGDINNSVDNSVTNPSPTPGPTPTPGAGGVTPAGGCPTIGSADDLTDSGTITGPTGTWRVCAMPTVFSENATLPYAPGVLYSLPGRVDVGVDDGPLPDATDQISGTSATLTIQPGVIVFGATSRAYLVVQRGSELNAVGTADRPIVFTSRDNVLGLSNESSSSQWGGVVLLGRGPVSDCSSGAPSNDRVACQQELEGALNPPSFGGPDAADTSGSIAYMQLRFSGATLSEGSELQSLTTGGVGSATELSYIMSYNSSDDGIELFGGAPKLRYTVVVGAEDDSYDIDTAAKADFQYAVAIQRPGVGDRALELDSPDADFSINALPRTNAQFTNFVFIAQGGGSNAIAVRGAADLNMSNGIIIKPGAECIDINGDEDVVGRDTTDDVGPPTFNSVLLDCTVPDADVQARLDAGTNNVVGYTSTLTNLFVNGATEDAAVVFDPTSLSSFFEASTFVGAANASSTWIAGWTCNSATANLFGASSCFTLPVYATQG